MRYFFLVCCIHFYCVQLPAQVSFEASCDTRQCLTGSSFNVEFRLNNAEGTGFQAPDFGGLMVVGGPSRSMSTTIINGRMSSSIGYVYTLMGTRPGKYTIGQAKINVSGKILKSGPLEIVIVKGASASKSEKGSQSKAEVFIRISTNKDEYFLGQQIILTTKLYTQVNIDNIESVKSKLPDKCEVEYISTEEPVVKEVLNGKEYSTKILSRESIFPLSAGKLTFPSRTYRVIISNPDPWGFSMKSMFFNTAQVLESNALELRIMELPKPLPENFSGAVGNFSSSFSKVNPVYSLSDAISIQLSIEGDGNFNHIDPKINLKDSLFELLQPGTSTASKISEDPLIKKTQSFEFLLSPKATGSVSYFPSFCYFDPIKKIYVQQNDTLEFKIVESAKLDLDKGKKTLQPIIHDAHSGLRLSNFFSWLILFFPMVLLLYAQVFSEKNVNSSGSSSWFRKILYFNKPKEVLTVEMNSDDLIIRKSKILFPDASQIENLYQLKNFLAEKQKTHSKAKILLNFLNEIEFSSFNPSVSQDNIKNVKQQIISL